MLHLTVPVLIPLNSTLPFFIANGMICSALVANAFFLKKRRANILLRRIYMICFHTSFIVMAIKREGYIFYYTGVIAIGILIVAFAH